MAVVQKIMEKNSFYNVDQFGVKNYHYGFIGLFSVVIFIFLNLGLGYITYLAEVGTDSPVQNYADAFWLMVMSSTTIGFGDVYPITVVGRLMVFLMFILGVGILGGVGVIFANKLFGFADTSVKNRELRKQNEEILAKLAVLEQRFTELDKK